MEKEKNGSLPLDALQDLTRQEQEEEQLQGEEQVQEGGVEAEPSAEESVESQPSAEQEGQELEAEPSVEGEMEGAEQLETETSEEEPAEAPEVQEPLPSAKPKYTPRYEKADTSKVSRRLTYIILFETILILALAGLDGYFAFVKIPELNKTYEKAKGRIKDQQTEMDDLTQQLKNSQSDASKLKKNINKLEDTIDERDEKVKSLEEENLSLTKKAKDLAKEIALLTEMKDKLEDDLSTLEEDYKQLNTNFKDAVNQRAESEKSIEQLNKKLADLQKEYDEFKVAINLKQKATAAKREKESLEYEKYAPSALRMVDKLNKVADSLKEGVTLKTFSQIIKDLEIPYEEFKITLNETSYNYISFKLLSSSYDIYRDTVGRWKNIARLNPGKEKWVDKVLKLEKPLTSDRPWGDQIQHLWQDAIMATQMAGLLIENKESFPEKCILCENTEKLPCFICNSTGKCFHCNGEGFIKQQKENIPCVSCTASGKCSACLGQTTVACKMCILKGQSKIEEQQTEPPAETPPSPPPPPETPPQEPEEEKEE
ncbi:MAG: hypothetical protein QME51_01835 [Planctomycetota bacterium]|nr:hypothetical protein [Planctomycetota bacterium]MDI6787092.1 hypothetical protein [Planctomycetota bacterium]